jgi:glycosyltransferase involved in cell wall biosynthesis
MVCDPEDVSSIADQVEWLLLDAETRIRVVLGGQDYVRRFHWDTSAQMLEEFLHGYHPDPDHYWQPASEPGSESLGGATT